MGSGYTEEIRLVVHGAEVERGSTRNVGSRPYGSLLVVGSARPFHVEVYASVMLPLLQCSRFNMGRSTLFTRTEPA
jgi:hypothetical protein